MSNKTFGNQCLPVVNFKAAFDCYDKINDDVFGTVNPVFSSGSWVSRRKLNKSVNLFGKLIENPLEITKIISENCKVQKVESTRTFVLELMEVLPLWKVKELEGMLHATHVYVDDVEYIFEGGTPFERLMNCKDGFRGKIVLRECKRFQIFGCGDCDSTGIGVIYIGLLKDGGKYYSDNGNYIGQSDVDVAAYFNSLPNTTATIETPAATFDYYSVIRIETSGLIDGFIYNGGVSARYRTYTQSIGDAPTANEIFGFKPTHIGCGVPTVGTITVTTMDCGMPIVGVINVGYMLEIGLDHYEAFSSGANFDIEFHLNIIQGDGCISSKEVYYSPDATITPYSKFTDVTGGNVAHLNNMPSGTYDFKIVANGCNGEVSNELILTAITIP